MWARPFQNCMVEWEVLEISTEETPSELPGAASLDGLQADAASLQAEFETSSSHLEEVRQRHTEVLVTAGMLPETGLAEIHPERALAWVVQGINGRMNPDGLTIPLLGTTEEAIQLHVNTPKKRPWSNSTSRTPKVRTWFVNSHYPPRQLVPCPLTSAMEGSAFAGEHQRFGIAWI